MAVFAPALGSLFAVALVLFASDTLVFYFALEKGYNDALSVVLLFALELAADKDVVVLEPVSHMKYYLQ